MARVQRFEVGGAASVGGRRSVVGRRFLLVAILLVATALRVIGLDNFPTLQGATPPGLEHDEVAHWLINRDILAGEHAIYFSDAYGHEALYHYAQAYFGAAVGDHALALRLPSAYLGVLLVAVSYALGRRMFGVRMGLISAAFLAVLFWPVFYSRLALRAISLPVLSGLSAWAWWRAFGPIRDCEYRMPNEEASAPSTPLHHSLAPLHARWLVLSGVLAGLSLHTYMAARAVPIFYALFTIYLALFHHQTFRVNRRGIAAFWLALAAVALPLVAYLLLNPGAEVRIAEVDAPLRALLAGDPRPVLENAVKIAGGFAVRGDPLWRQGIAGRPIFDPVLGLLFYAGVALCLWRWREQRHAFLLLWLLASVVPSLVTIDAPSTIRMINLLPVLMIYPLLPVQALVAAVVEQRRRRESDSTAAVKSIRGQVIHFGPQLSTVWTRLSTDFATAIAGGALILLLLYHAWGTAAGLWRVWPANEEVQFVWQAALTEAAAYLDGSAAAGPVAVGGWTPETMDPPTMELSLRRDDLALRFFNPTESLLLPEPDNETATLVRPAILSLAPALEVITGRWEISPPGFAEGVQFARYQYDALPTLRPDFPADVAYGDELRFLGHSLDPACSDPEETCGVTTFWRVLSPAGKPRRIFLHVMGPDGALLAQDDRLGAPAEYWQPGDVVIQRLIPLHRAGELRLGVYDPVSGQRLLTEDGGEYSVLNIQ